MNEILTVAFTIYRTAQQNYFFKLKSGAGALLLTGYPHSNRAACEKDISSVKFNAGISSRFQYRMTRGTLYVFLLKSSEGKLIAKSEAFANATARDMTFEMIKNTVRDAAIYDLT